MSKRWWQAGYAEEAIRPQSESAPYRHRRPPSLLLLFAIGPLAVLAGFAVGRWLT